MVPQRFTVQTETQPGLVTPPRVALHPDKRNALRYELVDREKGKPKPAPLPPQVTPPPAPAGSELLRGIAFNLHTPAFRRYLKTAGA